MHAVRGLPVGLLVAATLAVAAGEADGRILASGESTRAVWSPGASPGIGAGRAAGCQSVAGRLVDLSATGQGTVGSMTGSIAGAYRFGSFVVIGSDPEGPERTFAAGTSTVTTSEGTLTLRETSSADTGDQTGDVNAAVLATVIGGTGAWSGAAGHLVYSGYFHSTTLSGEFAYTGTICTPALSRRAESMRGVRSPGVSPGLVAASAAGCHSAAGRLVDLSATGQGTVGSMTGSIAGAYRFGSPAVIGSDPEGPERTFGAGTSTVTTGDGTLTLRETASADTGDQTSDVNAAVLATVIDGTGAFADTVGHLVYSGYFHSTTLSGEFAYTGTLCTPQTPPRATPPARPQKPTTAAAAYGRGVRASVRPLRQCPPRWLDEAGPSGGAAEPVCGFQATFTFGSLPAKGAKLNAAWYYNRRRVGSVPKAKAKVVKSFIAFTGPIPRGFYWCDLVVQPPGRPARPVARAVVRR
jgi:hypothetical protein